MKIGMLVLFVTLFLSVLLKNSLAGVMEVGAGFSYSRSALSNNGYNQTRKWTSNFGYHFTEESAMEFEYENSVETTKIPDYQDTTYYDAVYSLSWIQSLVPSKDFPIQPFVKGGFGQLNRRATGSYANGISPASEVDSLTVVLGAGLKVFLTQRFSLRLQAVSYLEGGRIRNIRDNVATTVGFSYYF